MGRSRESKVVAHWEGDEVYDVLPLGAIPAVDKPTFLTGKEGEAQMMANEPVLGLKDPDRKPRAYSLWHLDAHEIVNDQWGDLPIAPTW